MKKVWIRCKADVDGAAQAARALASAMSKYHIEVLESLKGHKPDSETQAVVCVSGDGTLLSAVQDLGPWRWRMPILAIHGSHGLGFMHALSVPFQQLQEQLALNSWAESIAKSIAEQSFSLEQRWGLEAQLYDANAQELGPRLWALNDFVVAKGPLSRMICFRLSINGQILLDKARGDGMIFSSSSGSTAYSMSAGGPVVDPQLRALLATPVCLHRMSQRPLVLGADVVVDVDILEGTAPSFITVDGQKGFELESGQRLRLQISEYSLKWIMIQNPLLKSVHFVEALRNKLGYGG